MATFNKSYPTKQTVSYSTYEPTKLEFGPLGDHPNNNAQKLAMIRYKTDPYTQSLCQIQSHNIVLFTYGIPRAGPYYPTDDKRAFIKIPEDVNDPKSVLFFNKMAETDALLESAKVKNQLFGDEKKAAFYKYQPIVRTAEQLEEDDDNNANTKKTSMGPRPRYMKVKIDLNWDTKEVTSKCFIKNGTKREQVTDVKTVDDLARYARYKSTICVLMIMNKLYASKAKVNGETKKYGVTFKLSQIVCDPPSSANNEQNDGDAFLDDDVGSHLNEYMSNVKISRTETDASPNLNQTSVKIQLSNDLDNDQEEGSEDDGSEDAQVVETVVKPAPVVATPVQTSKPTTGRRTTVKKN
jgi:hypothetical protein